MHFFTIEEHFQENITCHGLFLLSFFVCMRNGVVILIRVIPTNEEGRVVRFVTDGC